MATEPTEVFDEELDPDVAVVGDAVLPLVDEAATTTDGDDDSAAEALDELEAEELEMLTDDESDETLVVDEAAEMRAIRRAEIAMADESVDEAAPDEFVCQSCFLVKRTSQLAHKRKKICLDCAS
jgi:hypothetical protein